MEASSLASPRPAGVARRAGGLLVAGVALLVLVGGLLVANYRGARTLRENLLAQHAQWIELHVVALGGALSGAEEDLRNLAESSEVAAFFESRDLGMSAQYGLELTLVPIRERLLALCQRSRTGVPPAFRRVALLDDAGRVLADSEGLSAPGFPGPLDRAEDERGAYLSPDGADLLLSRAHWFKGRYVGHLVAWLRASTLLSSMGMSSSGEPGLFLLVDRAGRAHRPRAQTWPADLPEGLAALAPTGQMVELGPSWLAARVPVPGEQLALVHAVRTAALLGSLSPLATALNLAVAAAAVLLLVLFALHSYTRSLVFKARLGESLRREREVAEKHAALEREVAGRERAQAELRASEARFRGIFDTVPEALVLLRARDEVVLDANPGFERTFGWRREEVLGRPLVEAGLPVELSARSLEEGEMRGVELRARRREGAAVDVQISARTAELAGERVVVAAARDVTEEKRLAETLRHSQRVDAMGDLAAGISHNFSNALAAILPNLEWCLEDGLSGPPGGLDVRHALEDALHATQSAMELARQLTLVARRERDARREEVDAVGVLRAVLRMCRSTFDRGLRIEDAIAPAEAIVLGPPGHLHQVLLNLCINARDALAASPEPELRVEAFERRGPVREGQGGSRHLVIRVRDNGCGMSPATLARLGEPFFSTKGPGRGTGLGLATAFGIVHDLGGRITFTSTEGKGTTFVVELPLVEGKRKGSPAAVGAVALAGRRILVVDDEPLVRAALFRQLRAVGAEVTGAVDGSEGLARVRAERFDVVLLDLSMPGMPGTQVLSELAADRSAPPVIVVSGDAHKAGAETAAAVLEKPVEAAELTRTIVRVLEKAAVQGR